MDQEMIYQFLMKPESIAVIGASNSTMKPGGRVFRNILEKGYGGELWPVNPKGEEIMGKPVYPNIAMLPFAPDLALIAIPADIVVEALSALGKKGCKAAIILSAGFGETGPKGKAMEEEILNVANRYEMSVIGPNCSGFLTPVYAGKFIGIIPDFEPGHIDVISGSGATVDFLMEQAQTRGLRFSHVINLGNSIQFSVEDILALLDENHGPESAKIVLLYLEAVNKPKKLLHHAQSMIQKGCTIIGIKSGATLAGAKAAASHTGAVHTEDHIIQALFDKAGILRVKSRMELVELSCALIAMKQVPAGNRACVITDAGGPGVMLCDELDKWGIQLPSLSHQTLHELKKVLPAHASFENPIDCLPGRSAEEFLDIFEALMQNEVDRLDVIFFISGNSGISDTRKVYDIVKFAQRDCSIPILPIFSSATTGDYLINEWADEGWVYFHDEVAAGSAVGKIINHITRISLGENEGSSGLNNHVHGYKT